MERCWGLRENHWNGSLLDSVETVIETAQTMTWKGKAPVVHLVNTVYETGITLTKKAMDRLETQVQRLSHLEKWFVDLSFPTPPLLET